MDIIGFSTGSLYQLMSPSSKMAIELVKKASRDCIEINTQFKKRIFLLHKRKLNLRKFKFITMHAPNDFIYDNNKKTDTLLKKIEKLHKIIGFHFIVFHPDRIKNFDIFKKYTFPKAIENLDNRSPQWAEVENLKSILNNHNFKLVLDITHCFLIDKSNKNFNRLYNNFKNKIAYIHLGGFNLKEKEHRPLFLTKQKKILEMAVKVKKFPIIIESVVYNKKQLSAEIDYIKNNLYA